MATNGNEIAIAGPCRRRKVATRWCRRLRKRERERQRVRGGRHRTWLGLCHNATAYWKFRILLALAVFFFRCVASGNISISATLFFCAFSYAINFCHVATGTAIAAATATKPLPCIPRTQQGLIKHNCYTYIVCIYFFKNKKCQHLATQVSMLSRRALNGKHTHIHLLNTYTRTH